MKTIVCIAHWFTFDDLVEETRSFLFWSWKKKVVKKEKYLEFYEKEVLRLAESNKMKTRFSAKEQPDAPRGREPSKTLTNNMASTAASLVPAKNDNDRMQRALAKLG